MLHSRSTQLNHSVDTPLTVVSTRVPPLTLTGATGKIDFPGRPIQQKLFTPSIEELDTRSMRPQTFHRPSLITFQTHMQEAVFSERARRRRHSEARARIGTRGGARVAFGTVSTTVMRSFNGVARRTSRVKVLSDHPALLHTNRSRLVSRRGIALSSRVCSDSRSVLTAARP